MGTITAKLNAIQNSKIAIRNALIAKGVSVPAGTPFRLYANKIALISGEGGGGNVNPNTNANYDGGAAGTNYLSSQIINGGFADNSNVITRDIKIDGGAAHG